jgi:hypothetical protein
MKLLLTMAMLVGIAQADNLTFSVLPNPVPQSASTPCIICGTTQAHNPPTFGYNNFDTTGHTGTLTLFSTNLFATLGDGVEDTLANNYTASEIVGVLAQHFDFGVAIDVNSAEGGNPPTIMQLESFQLLDLTTLSVISSLSGPISMPDINPGNGMGDYLISGFNLTGVNAGDRLAFRAVFTGATDGPDSFYLVAQPTVSAVPEPGSWLLLASLVGITGLVGKLKLNSPRL